MTQMTADPPYKTRFVYSPFTPVPLEAVTGIILVIKYLPTLRELRISQPFRDLNRPFHYATKEPEVSHPINFTHVKKPYMRSHRKLRLIIPGSA